MRSVIGRTLWGMAAKPERVLLDVGGREVAVSNPDKVYFPEAGITKLDVVRYYLAVADGALRGAGGRPNVLVRYAERHRRRVLLPEARARRRGPTGSRSSRCSFPSGPRRPRRSCRATPPRSPGWRTSAASSCTRIRCAPRTSTTPTSCASTSTRCPGVEWPQIRGGGRASCTRRSTTSASSAGRRPRARAASTSTCASTAAGRSTEVRRAALALAREVERRAPDARHQQVVEGGAPRRLPRLQPERQGPHGRRRLLGAAEARRARVGAADVGRARRRATRRTSRCARCRRASRAIGDRHAGDRRPARARSTRCSSCRRARRREGLGDAPWPPHYAKQAGRAAARRAVARKSGAAPAAGACSTKPLVEIGRAAREGGRARRARALEGAPSRGGGAPRAGRRARRLDARPLVDLDARPRQPASTCPRRCGRRRSRSIPTTIRGREASARA